MNATRILSLSVLLLLQQGFVAQGADTWYANCKNAGAQDGLTEATGFVKIQDAVNKAQDGDTVIVLPGLYDGSTQGATDDYTDNGVTSRSRVVIGRRITLRSRDGAAKTTIAGQWHDATTPAGENAVRGIAVTNDAGAVIQGFTICNGSTTTAAGNKPPSYGGGIIGSTAAGKIGNCLVVDCVVSNCCCTRGGAMAYATAVRTLFVGNKTSSNYILRKCGAFNCVFLYNGQLGSDGSVQQTSAYNYAVVGESDAIVNCTFIANGGPAIAESGAQGGCYNCLAVQNGKDGESIKGNNDAAVESVWSSVVGGTQNLNVERKVVAVADEIGAIADFVLGDFRPTTTCGAIAAGDISFLEKIPVEYRDTDFYGNPRTTEGKVNAGAVEIPFEPKGGRLFILANANMNVISRDGQFPKYAIPSFVPWMIQSSEWPAQATIGVDPLSDRELFGWLQSGWEPGGALANLYRFADETGETRFTLPPEGVQVNNEVLFATRDHVYYVDPSGDDIDNDGSRPLAQAGAGKGPFQTLQKAANVVAEKHALSYSVIHAAAGTYAKGGVVGSEDPSWSGWSTRLGIRKSYVLIRGAGPGNSIIKGQCDTSATGLENWGCGPDGIRCVSIAASGSGMAVCVAGFTLTDGCVNAGASGSGEEFRGGGFYAKGGYETQLVDCTVTNCAGSRGGALYGGWWQRCLVVGNHNETKGNSSYRVARASSCIFRDNQMNTGYYAHAPNGFYQCLFDEPLGFDLCGGTDESFRLYNNVHIASGSKLRDSASDCYGGNWTTYNTARTGWTKTSDLGLLSISDKDYRPLSTSPLVTGGAVGSAGGDRNYYCALSFESYDGKTLRFVDGKPIVGPFQRPAYKIHPSAVVAGDISPTADHYLSEGETLEFTSPNANGKRQFLGYLEDGELVSTGSPTFVYSLTKDPYPGSVVEVRALYNTNWYANADAAYADTNDGWTPETARHSLAAAVSDAVKGDVIHVARGTYDNESATGTGHTCPSRVVLLDGISLVSDEGAALTTIKGRIDTTEDADDMGRGPKGIRCVAMFGASRLEGFTLADGRTGNGTENAEPNNGAGVYAAGADCLVMDCVLTNNCAIRSGGAKNGKFVRCRFVDNYSKSNGNAGQSCYFFGCYFKGNKGHSWLVQGINAVIGCTFDTDNVGAVGVAATAKCIDTVCLAASASSGYTCAVLSNCVLSADCKLEGSAAGGNVTLQGGETVIDANGVPVLGGKAIDKGVLEPSLGGYANGVDLFGTQRVYNGAQDIGAVERDWRGDYAARIGGGVTVTMASPEVEDSDRGVYLPSGGLTFVAPASCGGKTYYTGVEVSGDGELVASLNGASAKSFQKGKGEYKARVSGGDELSFVYHAADADTDGAYLSGFGSKGVVLVVR